MWVWEPLLITSGEQSRLPPHLLQGHLLWETPTCWQWSVTRRHEGHTGAQCTMWTWSRIGEQWWWSPPWPTRARCGAPPRLPGVAHRKYKHHSQERGPRPQQREHYRCVNTVNSVNTPAFNKLFLVLPRAPRHRDWTRINLCDWNRNLLRFMDENVYWNVTFLRESE